MHIQSAGEPAAPGPQTLHRAPPSPGRATPARRRAALALGLAVAAAVAACTTRGAPDTGGPPPLVVLAPAASISRLPATTTADPTTADPTATDTAVPSTMAAGSPTASLRGDGLGVTSFGDDAETAVTALATAFGPPDVDSGWEGGRRSLNFGLLYVELREEGGARRFTGVDYTLPAPADTVATPSLDTPDGLGLASGRPLTIARFAASGPPVEAGPDLAGARCVAGPGGPLCAYGEGLLTERGGEARPTAPGGRVIAVVAGRIQPFGRCP